MNDINKAEANIADIEGVENEAVQDIDLDELYSEVELDNVDDIVKENKLKEAKMPLIELRSGLIKERTRLEKLDIVDKATTQDLEKIECNVWHGQCARFRSFSGLLGKGCHLEYLTIANLGQQHHAGPHTSLRPQKVASSVQHRLRSCSALRPIDPPNGPEICRPRCALVSRCPGLGPKVPTAATRFPV